MRTVWAKIPQVSEILMASPKVASLKMGVVSKIQVAIL
jgi:hypothetical protein